MERVSPRMGEADERGKRAAHETEALSLRGRIPIDSGAGRPAVGEDEEDPQYKDCGEDGSKHVKKKWKG